MPLTTNLTPLPPTESPLKVNRIILPDDNNCSVLDRNGYCYCRTWSEGDHMNGFVEVSALNDMKFSVEVRLEGFCRTWIRNLQDSPPSQIARITSDLRFLQEIDIAKHRPLLLDTTASVEICRLPFNFVVPRRLVCSLESGDQRLTKLYPSFKHGAIYTEETGRQRRFMQPLIFYRLLATVKSKSRPLQSCAPQCEREIIVMPLQAVSPPLYVDAFQDEYTFTATAKVRRHFYSRSIGRLQLSAEEAPQVNILASSTYASTNVPVKILFGASQGKALRVEPYNWTWVVRSQLRTRIFYSSRDFEHEPSIEDARMSEHISMHTCASPAETREYTGRSWRMSRISDSGTILNSDPEQLPWLTHLEAVVSVPRSCIPCFFSARAALRYSIILNIRVSGQASATATLELPVQVVRYTPSISGDHSTMGSCSLLGAGLGPDGDRQIVALSEEEELGWGRDALPKYRRWTS